MSYLKIHMVHDIDSLDMFCNHQHIYIFFFTSSWLWADLNGYLINSVQKYYTKHKTIFDIGLLWFRRSVISIGRVWFGWSLLVVAKGTCRGHQVPPFKETASVLLSCLLLLVETTISAERRMER